MYARAKEDSADVNADEIREISDNLDEDPNSRRVRIDARKWIAAKLKPRKYGDKIEIGGTLTLGQLLAAVPTVADPLLTTDASRSDLESSVVATVPQGAAVPVSKAKEP
jgi:hypothetical protein